VKLIASLIMSISILLPLNVKAAVTHGIVSMCFEDRLHQSDLDFNEFCLDIETTLAYSGSTGLVNGDLYAVISPIASGNEDDLQLRISQQVAQTITGKCSVLNEHGKIDLSTDNRVIYESVADGFIGGGNSFVNSTYVEVSPNPIVLKCSGFGGTSFNVNEGLSVVLSKTISLFNKQ